MSRLAWVRWYLRVNTSHPTITQVLTTATLMSSGDAIAQKVVEKKDRLSLERTARFFFVGCLFVGPGLRIWYPRLDRMVSPTSKMRAVKMVLIDQTLFTPLFVPGFLAVLGVLQGHNVADITETVRRDTLPILMTNWMVWPATQAVNFNFVPLQFRVLFASGVALFWNVYLAWKANQDRVPVANPAVAAAAAASVVVDVTNVGTPGSATSAVKHHHSAAAAAAAAL